MKKRVYFVLVVDDEPQLRNLLCRILEQEGYRVMAANDGDTALQIARKETPDLILLDLMMPGMDGREVCRTVREISPATQIVYFTGKTDPNNPARFRDLLNEADALIAKPASTSQIVSTISRVLGAPSNNG